MSYLRRHSPPCFEGLVSCLNCLTGVVSVHIGYGTNDPSISWVSHWENEVKL